MEEQIALNLILQEIALLKQEIKDKIDMELAMAKEQLELELAIQKEQLELELKTKL